MVSQCKIARHGLTLQSQWLSALHSITQLQSLKVVILHYTRLFLHTNTCSATIWGRFYALNSITGQQAIQYTLHQLSLSNSLFVVRQKKGTRLSKIQGVFLNDPPPTPNTHTHTHTFSKEKTAKKPIMAAVPVNPFFLRKVNVVGGIKSWILFSWMWVVRFKLF